MDKKESREIQVNTAVIVAGIAIVTGLIVYSRGLSWFSSTSWARVPVIDWVIIVAILGAVLVFQYYFLMLLRYSIARFLILWLLPVVWLFNNGLVAIQRIFDVAAETSLTGWIPITDLIGWLLGAVYFPMLIGGGVIVALLDSSSILLAQVCNVAGMTVEVTGTSVWDFFSGLFEFFRLFFQLLGNSFLHEVITDNLKNQSFFDLGLSGVFRLPRWFYSAGYSFTCIIG